MELRKVFAKNLRRLRTAAGLSQEELAFRAGLDRTYISALERGLYSASVVTIERLANALDIEPTAFLQRPAKVSDRKH
jgi:transcriptional regulator with XRE-family HTH domain